MYFVVKNDTITARYQKAVSRTLSFDRDRFPI